MNIQKVKIIGTGAYLPSRRVTAEEIEQKLGVPSGWVAKKSGVMTRYFVKEETLSQMGAWAAQEALVDAGLELDDIDCIVSASGTVEQAIPCTASLIYKELDPKHYGIPAFDINSTCLSFITALDHLSYLVEAGRYQRILLISSEIAPVGLNWNHRESAALFGDGAAACVISKTPDGEPSALCASAMATYSQGAHLSEIRGGGSKYHPRKYFEEIHLDDFLFDMDGQALYRMSARYLPEFVAKLFASTHLRLADIDLVIPHQASMMALRLIQKRLRITDEQMFLFAEQYGNMIAASIPLGIHLARKQGRIQRGNRVLLLGTSAGLSLGGSLLVY